MLASVMICQQKDVIKLLVFTPDVILKLIGYLREVK